MSNVPLPEPHHQSAANFNAPDEPFYTADQMHAHAAAVSAADNRALTEERDALRERVEALEKALQTLLIERDGHYSTAAAWEAARAAMTRDPKAPTDP